MKLVLLISALQPLHIVNLVVELGVKARGPQNSLQLPDLLYELGPL